MSIYQIVTKAVYQATDGYRHVAHYEFPAYVPLVADIQDAIDDLDAAYKARWQTVFTDDIVLEGYDVRRVDIADQPTIGYVGPNNPWAGTNVGDCNVPQSALLCTFKALTTFPRTTRTYMFPTNSGTLSAGGRVDAATTIVLNAWGADVVQLLVVGDTDAQKVAVKYTGTPPTVTSSNQVTIVTSSSNFSTLDSRKSGVGS